MRLFKAEIYQQLWRNKKGQDLIEYALLAGFVAVAAGSVFPTGIAPSIRGIFTSVGTILANTIGG